MILPRRILKRDTVFTSGNLLGVLFVCVELEKKECHWAIRSLGMTAVFVSKLLGISQSAVTRAAYRGEAIAAANSLELVETNNA